MTIIAYRDGVLAADRRIVTEKAVTIVGDMVKIGRAKGGRWAIAGDHGCAQELLNWFSAGRVGPQPYHEDADGMLIWLPDSLSNPEMFTEGRWWRDPDAEFWAWGSGRDFALGAMGAGATAEEACKVAMMFDPCCGGTVDVLRRARR